MQIKQIALAVATVFVAGQAAAAAVTQADIVAARANHTLQETWLSGASAPTFNIFDGFALGCDAGSVSIFHTGTATNLKPGSTGNFMGYACTRGGTVSVMYHTVDGGSFNAYAPHLTGTAPDGTAMPAQLKRVKNLGTVSCTGSGSVTIGSNTYTEYKGCATVVGATAADAAPVKPAGGFSDVEAGLFGMDVSAAGTEANANVTQVFGVAVSKNLYRELQVAQGIYASVAAANTADPSYDPANAPNITKAQYTSIAQASGGYQTDWSPLLGTAGAGKNVYLARRVATSGTQASSNAFFLSNPCATGATAGSLEPATAAMSSATFIVTEGSGTGNVKTALTNAGNAGNFAIGVVSVENNWRNDAAASEGYRFVKVDGVHPEAGDTTMGRTTAINGGYAFQMEMKSFVANSAVGTFGETLIGEIAASLGNPSSCADVPRGLFLNPAGGSSCTVGVEVGKGTKFGNNCSPVQLFF